MAIRDETHREGAIGGCDPSVSSDQVDSTDGWLTPRDVQIQAVNFANPHRRIISICTNYDRLRSIRAKPERAAESLDTASAAGRLVIHHHGGGVAVGA